MIDDEKTSDAAQMAGFGEAERMAKIRELLVGPALADESARVDQSVSRLSELAKVQNETIAALQTRIQELEQTQRIGMDQLRLRLLGLVETLLADEEDLRARLAQNDMLMSRLDVASKSSGE